MSTLNIGGQLIENTDYSTGEVKTGARWIDGKPIYRRVFQGTLTTYNDQTNRRSFGGTFLTNVDSVIQAYGFYHSVGGTEDHFNRSIPGSTMGVNLTTQFDAMFLLNSTAHTLGAIIQSDKVLGVTALAYTYWVEYTKIT